MRTAHIGFSALIIVAALTVPGSAMAQNPDAATASKPVRVDVMPARQDVEVGQTLKFEASAYDQDGRRLEATSIKWVAAPFDVAAVDEVGNVTFFLPGEVRVGAIFDGKPGFATITIKPQSVARIDLEALKAPLAVGAGVKLAALARTSNGDPRTDVEIEWSSATPGVATVDPAGVVTGVAPGKAQLTASSGRVSASLTVTVIANPVRALSVSPRSTRARSGDVVHFSAAATVSGNNVPAVRWAVTGSGATIEPDGAFVAEQPGTYTVTASSGERSAVASVVVTLRNVARELEIVGRTPLEEFQTTEEWVVGNYAYVGSLSGRMWVYDVSNPSAPIKTDSVAFDARLVNDVSTTADGKIIVATREGASNRKNGIVFLDNSEPAHPKVISEYTATVTGGVHSAFVDGHFVYLTDDATGSLRVIDFEDVKNPKEVARWQVENPLARTYRARRANRPVAATFTTCTRRTVCCIWDTGGTAW